MKEEEKKEEQFDLVDELQKIDKPKKKLKSKYKVLIVIGIIIAIPLFAYFARWYLYYSWDKLQKTDYLLKVDFKTLELGEKETELNREFGAAMADCCDEAILVGRKRSEAIADGLREKGYPEQSIRIVSTLEEATEVLKNITNPGDTVLFENDLPDNYTET